MMAYLVGVGGGGERVSVGSEVHTADYSFSCTTCLAKPIFVCLEACCLLLVAKAENFVKYTFIYNTTLFFYTFANHFCLYLFCETAFPISCKVEALYATINARIVPCMIDLLVGCRPW